MGWAALPALRSFEETDHNGSVFAWACGVKSWRWPYLFACRIDPDVSATLCTIRTSPQFFFSYLSVCRATCSVMAVCCGREQAEGSLGLAGFRLQGAVNREARGRRWGPLLPTVECADFPL